jgi:RNA-directed DNA polymerase
VLQKVAARINDDKVMRLLGMILKTSGKCGVSQGGVISPLLSNLYLNDVDRMLEKATTVTQINQWTMLEYVRFADDSVSRALNAASAAGGARCTLHMR